MKLSKATNSIIYCPNYSRPPEHPWPVPVEDCLGSYRWLLETANVSPSNIVFAGDSAGGGMILSVLGAAKKEGLPLPAGGKNFCCCSFLILYTMKM